MQLGDVPPCVATDDDDVLKEEPSEPENNLNTSETPQPILPVDKGDENGHEDVGVSLHSENKTDAKVQVSSPKAGDGNGKKRKNWLLSDSEVIIIIIDYVSTTFGLKRADLSEQFAELNINVLLSSSSSYKFTFLYRQGKLMKQGR